MIWIYSVRKTSLYETVVDAHIWWLWKQLFLGWITMSVSAVTCTIELRCGYTYTWPFLLASLSWYTCRIKLLTTLSDAAMLWTGAIQPLLTFSVGDHHKFSQIHAYSCTGAFKLLEWWFYWWSFQSVPGLSYCPIAVEIGSYLPSNLPWTLNWIKKMDGWWFCQMMLRLKHQIWDAGFHATLVGLRQNVFFLVSWRMGLACQQEQSVHRCIMRNCYRIAVEKPLQ